MIGCAGRGAFLTASGLFRVACVPGVTARPPLRQAMCHPVVCCKSARGTATALQTLQPYQSVRKFKTLAGPQARGRSLRITFLFERVDARFVLKKLILDVKNGSAWSA